MFFATLRALFRRRPIRQSSRLPALMSRLRLEYLEGRWVPATLTVGSGQQFATIQAALTSSLLKDGDTINVRPGIYTISGDGGGLNITKNNIRLTGFSATSTIIRADASLINDAIIDVLGSNARITGFTIDGNGNASAMLDSTSTPIKTIDSAIRVASGASATLSNNTIRNLFNSSVVEPNQDVSRPSFGFGVHVLGTATVSSNTIQSYYKSGIFVDGSAAIATITSNQIRGLGPSVVLTQYGIDIRGGAVATVQSNNITDNHYARTFSGNSSAAVLVSQNADARSVIASNQISNNQNGILLANASNVVVRSNSVQRNASDGILLTDSNSNEILFNTVAYNGSDSPITSYGPGGGITLFDSNQNDIRFNVVASNTLDGIYIGQSATTSSGNEVSGNTVLNNGNNGIYLFFASNTQVTSNISLGNGDNGLQIEGGTNNLVDELFALGNLNDGIKLLNTNRATVQNSQMAQNGGASVRLINSTNATIQNNRLFDSPPFVTEGSTTGLIFRNNRTRF